MDIEFTGDKAAYARALREAYPPRYATEADLDAIHAFDRAVFDHDAAGRSSWRYRLGYAPDATEVWEVGSEIIACWSAELQPSRLHANRAYGYINSFGVAEAYRGRGIGTWFFERCIEKIFEQEDDLTGICLDTRVSNVAMQGLAAKFGFVISQRVQDFYIHGSLEDAYEMALFAPVRA